MSEQLINKNRFVFLGDSPDSLQNNKESIENRRAEIYELLGELKNFSINLKNLTKLDISIKERNLILNIAFIVASNENLLNEFLKSKKINLEKISYFCNEPILNISAFKDYLKLYILLLYSEKYSSLVEYLNILDKDITGKKIKLKKDDKSYIISNKSYGKESQDNLEEKNENYNSPKKDPKKEGAGADKEFSEKKVRELKSSSKKDLYSGIIISTKGLKRIILTSTGEIKWVLKDKNSSNKLGEIIVSKEAKPKRKLRLTIVVLSLLILILFTSSYVLEKKVASTVLFKANGDIKITFNEDNKLIHAYPTNNNGNIILEDADFEEKNIDYVLGEILEQAYIKKIIKEFDTITIIISGAPLREKDLINGRFNDRIISYKVKCKINNDGSLIYLK